MINDNRSLKKLTPDQNQSSKNAKNNKNNLSVIEDEKKAQYRKQSEDKTEFMLPSSISNLGNDTSINLTNLNRSPMFKMPFLPSPRNADNKDKTPHSKQRIFNYKNETPSKDKNSGKNTSNTRKHSDNKANEDISNLFNRIQQIKQLGEQQSKRNILDQMVKGGNKMGSFVVEDGSGSGNGPVNKNFQTPRNNIKFASASHINSNQAPTEGNYQEKHNNAANNLSLKPSLFNKRQQKIDTKRKIIMKRSLSNANDQLHSMNLNKSLNKINGIDQPDDIDYDDLMADDTSPQSFSIRKSRFARFCEKIPCCRKGENKYKVDINDSDNYLEITNENDYTDYPELKMMSTYEREQRLLELWNRAFQKAKGAAVILSTFEALRTKIQLFGRQLLVNSKKKQDETVIIEKSCPLIIMPQSKFKLSWNLVIIVLLLYTATYMPYRICFIDDASTGSFLAFEYMVDVLFFLDILINFNSALEMPDGTIDPRLKFIAMAYMKSWFFLDLCATFPTQFLEAQDSGSSSTSTTSANGTTTTSTVSTKSNANYNKLLRLARLPRLYRLLRILRLFKIVKILRYNQTLQRLFDKIKMNAAVSRMIFTLVFAFFSVHLISCFWYLASKFDDNNPDTWVSRLKLIDEEPSNLYLECLYWSLQTVSTVGFGDFGAYTIAELFLCIVWMIFGVGFYSFVIGNLTSIIANENANSENLYNKLKALEEFAKKTSLPEELHFKIRQFLENNYNELFSRIDENQLLQELPITLRDEVFIHKYQGLLDTIEFLRDCDNNEFVWAMVQLLRKIKVDKDDVVYWEGDFAEEIYFIKSGKIRLYAENGFPFATYSDGQHFGDPEVIFKETRDGKAVAQTDCLFYGLHKDDLEKLIEQHEDMRQLIFEQAKSKKQLHQKNKDQASKVQPVYGQSNKGANFLKQAMKQKFGMNGKEKKIDEGKDPFEKEKEGDLKLDFSNLKENEDDNTYSKMKKKSSSQVRPQTDDNSQRVASKLQDDDKSAIPSSSNFDNNNFQAFKKHRKASESKNSQESATQIFKKKQRMNKMLQNVDSAPDFTKNVSNLLQSQIISNNQNSNLQQINNRQQPPNTQRGFQDNSIPHIQINDYDNNQQNHENNNQSPKFKQQKNVEELKKEFKFRNKVSTLESYEKKKNDNFSVFNNNMQLPQVQVPSIQEIIEQDENLGDADAEQGLENLARFNQDMSMIALNVYQVYNLFDLIGKENEEIIQWMHSLERQTVSAEERQSNIEKRIDTLITNTINNPQ